MIAAPFLGLFTILLASADPIFSNAIEVALRNLDLGPVIRQTAFALAMAWLTRGTLAVALADRIHANGPGTEVMGGLARTDEPVSAGGRLGIGETSVALGLILALFMTFVVFQLRYLFLPPERLGYTFDTITYSEYAREGFFQLLVVVGIAILLMASLDGWTRRLKPLHHWAFNGLTLALVASTFVIVASSFRRLQMYGFEHSFTHLRLFSHSFTVWLGVVLVLLAVAVLMRRPRVFAFGTLVTLMIYAAALDLLNPDAFIATANLDHRSLYGKEMDLRNLVPLGEDAVPVLVARLDELDASNRRAVSQLLELQLERTQDLNSRTGWQSANTSRQEALRWLEPRAAELAAACALTNASSAALARRSSVERQQQLIHTLQALC